MQMTAMTDVTDEHPLRRVFACTSFASTMQVNCKWRGVCGWGHWSTKPACDHLCLPSPLLSLSLPVSSLLAVMQARKMAAIVKRQQNSRESSSGGAVPAGGTSSQRNGTPNGTAGPRSRRSAAAAPGRADADAQPSKPVSASTFSLHLVSSLIFHPLLLPELLRLHTCGWNRRRLLLTIRL